MSSRLGRSLSTVMVAGLVLGACGGAATYPDDGPERAAEVFAAAVGITAEVLGEPSFTGSEVSVSACGKEGGESTVRVAEWELDEAPDQALASVSDRLVEYLDSRGDVRHSRAFDDGDIAATGAFRRFRTHGPASGHIPENLFTIQSVAPCE